VVGPVESLLHTVCDFHVESKHQVQCNAHPPAVKSRQ
jgi:hypothetical protein